MIRVLHYLSGLSDIKAGVETYILNLYSDLPKDEFEFCILTRNAKKGSLTNELFQSYGITIYEIPIQSLNALNVFRFRKALNAFFDNHRNEFDFIHMHGCDDPFIIQIAKQYGIVNTAIHIHTASRENDDYIKNAFKIYTSKSNIKNVDYKFACSKVAGNKVFHDRSFTVVNNSIDTNKFAFSESNRKSYRDELGLSKGQYAICYCGRFAEIKNLPFLLNVFNNLVALNNQARLFLIGNGECKNDLIDYVDRLNIREYVNFVGELQDVSGILSAMDLYLQTSFNEGFSFSALEAQCSGLPTVLSNGFPKDIVLTDLVIMESINEEANVWAETINSILLSNHKDRKKYSSIIKAAGFDSKDASHYISGVYKNAKNS